MTADRAAMCRYLTPANQSRKVANWTSPEAIEHMLDAGGLSGKANEPARNVNDMDHTWHTEQGYTRQWGMKDPDLGPSQPVFFIVFY